MTIQQCHYLSRVTWRGIQVVTAFDFAKILSYVLLDSVFEFKRLPQTSLESVDVTSISILARFLGSVSGEAPTLVALAVCYSTRWVALN